MNTNKGRNFFFAPCCQKNKSSLVNHSVHQGAFKKTMTYIKRFWLVERWL